MNIFFPELQCALIVRKDAPKGAQLVLKLGVQSVYLIDATEPPPNAEIAKGPLGGWNFGNGWAISLVFASTIQAMYQYRREVGGKWVVLPRRRFTGGCVGLMLAETGIPISMGCTPVIAETALAQTE